MDNEYLFNLSLIISIFGLFLLIVILENTELKETNISEINDNYIDRQVKVSGTIKNLFETEGLYIFNVESDSKIIKAILFKDNKTILYNDFEIELEGKVTEYEDELEIISKKITLK